MKHLAKKLFKSIEKEIGEIPEIPEIPEIINQDIPKYKEIENHKEAKMIMEDYLNVEIEKIESLITPVGQPKTYKILEQAKEILSDPKFIEQRKSVTVPGA